MLPFHEFARTAFPRLTADNYRITSPATPDYNCIALAAGVTDAWWWPTPGRYWPAGAPREETLEAFVAVFTTLGYAPCAGADSEPGLEKVALSALAGAPTHAARQLPGGAWASKLGPNIDIEHATPEVLGGGVYGEPVLFLSRLEWSHPLDFLRPRLTNPRPLRTLTETFVRGEGALATPVVLIAGDGIGPEVTTATQAIVAASGADIAWVEAHAGLPAIERFGDPLPAATLDLIRRYRVALKGPCTTPSGKGYRSINVRLRKELDLYASIRPVRTLPGIKVPYQNVDLVVVRENTEGLYSGQEHVVVPGVVESLRIITRTAAERIVRYAFDLARNQGRRRVTFCHKADVLPLSDGLFLATARAVADDYPFLEFEEMHVDTLCLQLALAPEHYDVLVMENLFGDVLSDLCAGLVGGLGLVPGSNIGNRYAVFEAVHGSAPDIAGKGLANPIALLRSAAMMLEHIGQRRPAQRIEESVRRTLQAGQGLTRDLGGEGNTTTLTEQLIANLA